MSAFELDRQAWLREYWSKVLTDAGTVSKAARLKGVHRTHLHKILRSIGIRSPRPKDVHAGNWGDL